MKRRYYNKGDMLCQKDFGGLVGLTD